MSWLVCASWSLRRFRRYLDRRAYLSCDEIVGAGGVPNVHLAAVSNLSYADPIAAEGAPAAWPGPSQHLIWSRFRSPDAANHLRSLNVPDFHRHPGFGLLLRARILLSNRTSGQS